MIELYLSQDPVVKDHSKRELELLGPYIDMWSEEDITGKKIPYIRLNDKGKLIAEFLMIKNGYPTRATHGIALQKRYWYEPEFLDANATKEIRSLFPKSKYKNGILYIEDFEDKMANIEPTTDATRYLHKILKYCRNDMIVTEIALW